MNEIAEKNNVNLIVLGSGENEKYSKLGTTSKKVIQYSTIPVWTVKKDCQTEIKNILCPVDLSEVSHRALNNAIHLAPHFKNGKSLLANGLVDDAVNAFNRCLKINHLHAPSWEGLATAYQRLGDDDKAKSCRNTSRDIQRRLWDVKIEAEIRSRNPMF